MRWPDSLGAAFGEDHDVLADSNFRIVLLANIAAPLGTALLSPVLDSLRDPFAVSATEIGLLITAFTAPGIVLIPLTGIVADRYGRKPVLVVGLVLFGTAGSAIAGTTDFRIAVGLRFLQGAGLAGITPVLITCIGDMYAGDREATAQGLRFGTSGLTTAVFPVIAGFLVVFAWQYPFFLYAMALPLAAIVYRRFDEPAAVSPRGESQSSSSTRIDHYLRTVASLLSRPHVIAFLVARAIPVFLYIGFLTYVSILLVQVGGGTPQQAGILVGVVSLSYASASTQAGRISATVDSRARALAGGNACLGLGLFVVALFPVVTTAVVGAAFIGIGFGITLSLYRSIVTGFAPADYRGSLVSAGETVGRVAATLSPVVIGFLVTSLEPSVGFAVALRWSLGGAAVVGSCVGITCVLVMVRTSPVSV